MERCKPGGRMYVYQMRSNLGEDPYEILTRLTHRVWQEVGFDGAPSLDPHLWPSIFQTLRDVFRPRLSFNPSCGQRDSCLSAPCALCGDAHGRPSFKKVHILETRQPIEVFLHGTAGALARRIRRDRPGDPRLKDKVLDAMRGVLKDNLFFSETCRFCPIRVMGAPDRREWPRDVAGYTWGGVRGVAKEGSLSVEEMEEA